MHILRIAKIRVLLVTLIYDNMLSKASEKRHAQVSSSEPVKVNFKQFFVTILSLGGANFLGSYFKHQCWAKVFGGVAIVVFI